MALLSSRPVSRRLRVGYTETPLSFPAIRNIESLNTKAEIKSIKDRAELIKLFSAKELDLALIPSSTVFDIPDVLVVPASCVAMFGESQAMVLLSKVLPTEIEQVLVDPSATASVRLLEFLLPKQIKIRPSITRSPIPLPAETDGLYKFSSHAFLLSGMNALQSNPRDFPWAWDLTKAWQKLENLPFVSLVWATHAGVDLRGFDAELTRIAHANTNNAFDAVVNEVKKRSGADDQKLRHLLGNVMRYELDSPCTMALRLFGKELSEAGLLGAANKGMVRFYQPARK